jgi:hypothetical protein
MNLSFFDPGKAMSQSATPFPGFHFLTNRPPPFTVINTANKKQNKKRTL